MSRAPTRPDPRIEATVHASKAVCKPPPQFAAFNTHSGNDGRIELETLSAAELGKIVTQHEGGVGPAIIHRLRQLQMGAKIREAQAARQLREQASGL